MRAHVILLGGSAPVVGSGATLAQLAQLRAYSSTPWPLDGAALVVTRPLNSGGGPCSGAAAKAGAALDEVDARLGNEAVVMHSINSHSVVNCQVDQRLILPGNLSDSLTLRFTGT